MLHLSYSSEAIMSLD